MVIYGNDYAMAVWHPYKIKHKIALENIQRRATKELPSMRDLSYIERLKLLKLPTLAYRRLRGDMIEVYKIIHNIYDHESVPNLLKNNEISQRTDKFWYSQDILYDFEAPLRISNNRTGTRDLILIDNENEELIIEEHRILRSEPS